MFVNQPRTKQRCILYLEVINMSVGTSSADMPSQQWAPPNTIVGTPRELYSFAHTNDGGTQFLPLYYLVAASVLKGLVVGMREKGQISVAAQKHSLSGPTIESLPPWSYYTTDILYNKLDS